MLNLLIGKNNVQKEIHHYRENRNAQTSSYALASETRFVYDGWNLIAELDATNSLSLTRSYLWGQDLSGSLQGAGGVGGLLAMTTTGTNAGTYLVDSDANGNVVGLVDNQGITAATYEHGPSGEPIRASGVMAAQNPFRVSSKYTDSETGLVYYGFRFYNPGTGRWISRDSIGENGGANLYEFCRNRTVTLFDTDGRSVPGAEPVPSGCPSPEPYQTAPSIFDHLLPPLGPQGGDTLYNTAWFDSHYPGWVKMAKQIFKNAINDWVSKNCEKASFSGPSKRLSIDVNNETLYGDPPQSSFSRDKVLGRFTFDYRTPVKITRSIGYSWKTEMYVEDVLGAQPGDNVYKLGLSPIFPSRKIIRANWTLSDSGCCVKK